MLIEHFAALSLNPALDITLRVDGIEREYNDVLHEQWEAAGKAVNVARVLARYGVACRTLILAGRQNRDRYFGRLDRDNVPYEVVETEGEIRENLSIVQPDDTLFRLARPGFTVGEEAAEAVQARLVGLVKPGTLLVLAGKNPRGLGFRAYHAICETIRALGGTLAVDTSSLCEQEMFQVRPWIIKPNLEELERMAGEPLDGQAALLRTAERYHKHGIENLLVSLGEQGVLFSGEGGRFIARVPKVHVRSAVGAGDSTLAGFLMAYARGRAIADCVRIAASFGTSSVLRDGTNPPLEEDVRAVYPQVVVEQL